MVFPTPTNSVTDACFWIGDGSGGASLELSDHVTANLHHRRILPASSKELHIRANIVEIRCRRRTGYYRQRFAFTRGDPRSFTGPDDFGGLVQFDHLEQGLPWDQRLEAMHILTQKRIGRGRAEKEHVLLVLERQGGFARKIGLARSSPKKIESRMFVRREGITFI